MQRLLARGFILLLLCVSAHNSIHAAPDDASWIWSAKYGRGQAPGGAVYFRTAFDAPAAESAKLEITCDNAFVAYLNGRRIGDGDDWHNVNTFDVKAALVAGKNMLAIRGENEGPGSAGLVAQLTLKTNDGKTLQVVTDKSWKSSVDAVADWHAPKLDDAKWDAVTVFGKFGRTAPWGGGGAAALVATGSSKDRFTPLAGFAVEEVLPHAQTGSLVAMTFDEDGNILCSREGGPLQIARLKEGKYAEIAVYSDKIKNAQGILAYRGAVYTVSDGPQGTAFYRLEKTADGVSAPKALFKFKGGMGEHGPHQPIVGPDGLIYIMIGNHAWAPEYAKSSPHHGFYEGDLVRPRYEDANGHAAGIKVPGGTVVRTDADGKQIELYSGGYRNAYDHAFNQEGELFTYDSDMEWDENLPWYRPVRINHVIAGSDYGWRSGWAVWPNYYVDALPTTLDLGRGSPTGVEFYNHTRFPQKYHNAFFCCDWSQGRLLAVTCQPDGGTYKCSSEVFLTGKPLPISDTVVGPDGWLYFCLGGRGSQGGLYRIVSTGPPPPAGVPPKGIGRALHLPQLYSAFTRREIDAVKKEMGDAWSTELVTTAESSGPPASIVRALDLMNLVGPAPAASLLVKLSSDKDAAVRAKAAYSMGLHSDDATQKQLIELLADPNATVQRLACEAIVRSGAKPPLARLLPLLGDQRPFVSWAARRVLESLPRDSWQAEVLASEQPRVVLQGSLALLTLRGDKETSSAVLPKLTRLLESTSSDALRTDAARLIEVALYQADPGEALTKPVREVASKLYPTTSHPTNRELVRLLTYLQEPSLAKKMVEQLDTEIPALEKFHIVMHAPFLNVGWTDPLTARVFAFYEQTQTMQGGNSFAGYFRNAARDFIKSLSPEQQNDILAGAAKRPVMAMVLVRGLLTPLSADKRKTLVKLVDDLERPSAGPARELAKEALLTLARSGDAESLAALRDLFNRSPERREEVAGAIAQFAINKERHADDWPLLMRSLPIVEGNTARDVLKALARFPNKPETADAYRQAILLGLRLQNNGGGDARALLEHWTGKKLGPNNPWDVALASWQKWFSETYPNQPEAKLPIAAAGQKHSVADVLKLLSGKNAESASAERGALVFEQALCIKCHRYGQKGEAIGPDLTTVSSRFQRKEIVESVLLPSAVISDQFAAKTVVTTAGQQFTGITGPAGDDVIVLQANGEKTLVKKADIEEIVPSKKSAMPDNLFDKLTDQQILDLFAYLARPPK